MQPRPTNGPLKLQSQRLLDKAGKRVYLLGAIVCCRSDVDPDSSKPDGWPLVNEANLDRYAEHGANYTHIRLGPNSALPNSPDRDHTGYARVSDTLLDLTGWDPAYWERVRNCVEAARERGIYVEVSLIDVWTLKHQALASAWFKEANQQHFNLGTTAIVNVKPHMRAVKWTQKVVDELGGFDNVVFLDGNEVFDAHSPDPSAWVRGLHDIVRERETEKGFKHHLFGTNSHVRALRFMSNTYEAFHTKEAVASAGRPVIVSEYGTIGPLQYRTAAFDAVHKESSFMAWRGGQDAAAWAQTLDYLQEVRNHVGF